VPDGGAGLLTIGEFARRSRLSMRALRLYDRIGLLRPAEVVPETGAKGHVESPQILSVYDTVHRWIRSRGLREVGPPREVYRYAADPDAAGPEDLVCDVAIPFG
jgi:hypothetical protein